MFLKLSQKPQRLFFASPLLFGAACVLLAVIIGVFAVNNLQREKRLMTMALSQEGSTILNLVSVTSRAMLRRAVAVRGQEEVDWRTVIQQAVENSADHPRIVTLYMADLGGEIIAHSDREQVGRRVDAETLTMLENLDMAGGAEQHRVAERGAEGQVFEIAVRYAVADSGAPMQHFHTMRGVMGRGRMAQMGDRPLASELQRLVTEMGKRPLFLVAELTMSDFHQAVRKQQVQVGVLSLVLLLVGAGGILSLLMLQGLRGSQQRLSRMREFTELLVSSLPIGLIATGADARVRTCNQSVGRMVGIIPEQAFGRSLTEVLPERLASWCSQKERSVGVVRGELRLPDADGIVKSLHLTRIPLQDELGTPTGIMLLIQDLSQIRDLEGELERAEREAAIGRMAAGVAHEVRNPLSSIKGLALLLKERLDDQGAASDQTANLLIAEVERLNRSIGELLDYARPAQLDKVPVSLDALVARAISLLRSDAEAGAIEIQERYESGDHVVAADGDKITQVVLNLCLNAIQAMGGGGVLAVRTGIEEDVATVTISDTGDGIDEEHLQRVFEPYFTTKADGTGLGLAMSKKIVEDHGGTLRLTSRRGHGTTTVIELPRQMA